MKEAGRQLKQVRTSKGVSLEQVAHAIKISPEKLESIEEGRWDGLPHLSFLRGFIRSYGEFLAMDTGELLETFDKEIQETSPEGLRANELAPHHDVGVRQSNWSRKLVEGGAILGLIFLISFTYQVVVKYQEEKVMPKDLETSKSLDKDASSAAAAQPLSDREALIIVEAYKDHPQLQEKLKEAISFSMFSKVPRGATALATPKPVLIKEANRQIASILKAKKEPQGEALKTHDVKYSQEVVIQAQKALRVFYELDDKHTFSRQVDQGGRLILKAKNFISLRINKGFNGATIFHNGKEVDTSKLEGVKASLKFP